MCTADPNRLAQLVGNLVSNAMTYGTPGSPVTVRSTVHAADFSITVHNEGSPIPPAVQQGIFQPMTRGTQAGASRSVGLGLFIVREIAKAHHGDATVESSAESGTTFRIVFPQR